MTLTQPPPRPLRFDPGLLRSLLRLSGPVALSRLGIMGMAIADVVMVGQIAPKELPIQALGWAPTGIFLFTAVGLLVGVQVLSARLIGENRGAEAGGVLRRGLILALVASLVIAALLWFGTEPGLILMGIEAELARQSAGVTHILALSLPLQLAFTAASLFVEGVQKPLPASVTMWLANGVNVGLNAALIPAFGAEGSAWATVGSRAFLALGLLGYLALAPGFRAYRPFARPHAATPGFPALLQIGVAAGLSQAAEAGAFSIMTIIAGRIGAEAVAAYQILLNLMGVVFMVALGVSTATAVLVAEARGRNDEGRAREAAWAGLLLNTAFMAAFGVVFLLAPDPISRAYTADLAIAGLVAAAMPAAAAALIPDGGQGVIAQSLRARGDNWFPTGSHVLSYVLVMPPLGWFLGERLERGVGGIIEAIVWASVLSSGVLAARQVVLTRARPKTAQLAPT